MKFKFIFTAFFILTVLISNAQQTVGLILHKDGNNENGYVLFAPMNYNDTYLIDKCGKLVHSWTSTYRPSFSVYLLPDGTLLRPGIGYNPVFNTGGIIEILDWNSTLIWQYTLSTATECQHHDVRALPNGNILAIAWDLKTHAEALAAGRRPNLTGTALWSEKIVELEPTGLNTANIVWEWKVWDHLIQEYDSLNPSNYGIIADHPELININYNPGAPLQKDWLHFNALDYNPDLDQIVISAHNFSEIWIIDHSTTTAEAAGHAGGNSGKGGDLLYRWGNPVTYHHGQAADKKFFGQHSPYWIPDGYPHAGSIMIFNNGLNRPQGNYSSVEILTPPLPDTNGNYNSTLPYLPAAPDWIYTAPNPTDLFSSIISGAQMYENGNVGFCSGSNGKMFEIDTADSLVWEYINPVTLNGPIVQGTNPIQNTIFRCTFYDQNYSGFDGQTLTSGDPIELDPISYVCDLTTAVNNISEKQQACFYPNPATETITISPEFASYAIQINDVNGQEVTIIRSDDQINISSLPSGFYIVKMISSGKAVIFTKLIKC
ncbi:MAG: aryl-sulfate sulfotransferase [Bacteroidetes bacterium]|nr:aryl-sulfate sulfotransferase [Bacteroidota bacterium]